MGFALRRGDAVLAILRLWWIQHRIRWAETDEQDAREALAYAQLRVLQAQRQLELTTKTIGAWRVEQASIR